MRSQTYRFSVILIACLIGSSMFVATVVIFHLGGMFARHTAQFFTLSGTFVAALVTFGSILYPRKVHEPTRPWVGREQWSWVLIGSGLAMFVIGESIWRYYASIGQDPFPSLADCFFVLFAPLVLAGLLLQPRPNTKSRQILLFMDSLISMGSILAVAWYLLLGSLTLTSSEITLAKFLGLYYPLTDIALLSCALFLLLRGVDQSRVLRVSLLLTALGLCIYTTSDFLFNVLNNLNLYVDGTWVDMGWPLGTLIISIAAYLRRFLPNLDTQHIPAHSRPASPTKLGLTQLLPYGLLGILLMVLILNVLSDEPDQIAIRPVLLYATVAVIILVLVRQIITLRDNLQLAGQQAEALTELERVHLQVAAQARHIAERNAELEQGIEHLTMVQAQLANGNLHVRALLKSGVLLPLAGSLNLMAERLMRLGEETLHGRRLTKALHMVLTALEQSMHGAPLSIPDSCPDTAEIKRLLALLRLKGLFLQTSPYQESAPIYTIEIGGQTQIPPSISSPPSGSLKKSQGKPHSGTLKDTMDFLKKTERKRN